MSEYQWSSSNGINRPHTHILYDCSSRYCSRFVHCAVILSWTSRLVVIYKLASVISLVIVEINVALLLSIDLFISHQSQCESHSLCCPDLPGLSYGNFSAAFQFESSNRLLSLLETVNDCFMCISSAILTFLSFAG